ncbi:MAG: sensor histidine kinase [Bacteroidota bacterium]
MSTEPSLRVLARACATLLVCVLSLGTVLAQDLDAPVLPSPDQLAIPWVDTSAMGTSILAQGAVLDQEEPTAWVHFRVQADSSVVLLSHTGDSLRLAAQDVLMIQREVAHHTGTEQLPFSRLEYGYRDGKLIVGIVKSADALAFAGLAVLLVVALIALLWWAYRRVRQEREQWKLLADTRSRLVENREEERLRLAQELHDGPIQDLHAIRMRLSMEAVGRPAGPSTGVGDLEEPYFPPLDIEEAENELLRVIGQLRGVSEDLRPPSLGPFGLAPALRNYIERFERLWPRITVEARLDEDGQQLPERVRLVLFRICQESMNNAAKHSEPSLIEIALTLDQQQVRLEVRDDGKGFEVPPDFSVLATQGRYGLLGMQERVQSIGADLTVTSLPSSGTTTRVVAQRDAHEWKTDFMQSKV